jgi:AmiR/NasT family two-component response regulator
VVWVAIGILMAKFDLTAPDALALLRGYSYMQDVLLDDAAADLVAGRLSVDDLRP